MKNMEIDDVKKEIDDNATINIKKSTYDPLFQAELTIKNLQKQEQIEKDARKLSEKIKMEKSIKHKISNSFINIQHRFVSNERKIYDKLSIILLGLFTYIACVFCFGINDTLPANVSRLWSVGIIWLVSYLTGYVFQKLDIPPLLGMLISGILLKNFPGYPVDGLPSTWSSTIRTFGLSLILIRSGLELDVPALIKAGWVCFRLTFFPGVTEAFVIGGVGVILFDMPFILALSLGFILAAVSPAVVVSGMFDLQSRGYGVEQGIPSLIVAAASFDDVVAISGFSVCIAAAIVTNSDHGIIGKLHGVINLVGGIAAGVIAGYLISLTTFWNTKLKRTIVTISVGLMCAFVGSHHDYDGGGALAGLMMSVVGSKNWKSGTPKNWSEGPNVVANHEVEHDVARLWNTFAQPLLFGVIGSSVDFRSIRMDIIPLAIIAVLIGMVARVSMAFLSTAGVGLELKARMFIALSWIPKATVQAALGSVPLEMVLASMSKDDPKYDQYVEWGNTILVIAVTAILITAPIGLIVINKLGPVWLTRQDDSIPLNIGNTVHDSNSETSGTDQISLEDGIKIGRSTSSASIVNNIEGLGLGWAQMEANKRLHNVLNSEDFRETNTALAKSFFSQVSAETYAILKHLDTLGPEGHALLESMDKILGGLHACEVTIQSQSQSFPCINLFQTPYTQGQIFEIPGDDHKVDPFSNKINIKKRNSDTNILVTPDSVVNNAKRATSSTNIFAQFSTKNSNYPKEV